MSARGARNTPVTALLPSLLVAAFVASPAAAQGPEGETIYRTREGQGFELHADVTLIIGGDVVGSCEALIREARPKPMKPDRELLGQVEACRAAVRCC